MALSRRQFFRRLWTPDDAPSPKRLARYTVLEDLVRKELLPYDFTLTPEQESYLIAAVRSEIEKAPNEELFSTAIRGRIEEVVENKLQPWRERSHLADQAPRLKEIRDAAPDYVTTYLSSEANAETIEQLKQIYSIDNIEELERLLKDQLRYWLSEVDDRLIAQYDILSVRDLVFAQLKSWC